MGVQLKKTTLIFYLKQEVRNKYLMELKIFRLHQDDRYKEGIKYSLIFLKIGTKNKILMDNHHPKRPHIHIGEKETPYKFKNKDALLRDFKRLVFKTFGIKL